MTVVSPKNLQYFVLRDENNFSNVQQLNFKHIHGKFQWNKGELPVYHFDACQNNVLEWAPPEIKNVVHPVN